MNFPSTCICTVKSCAFNKYQIWIKPPVLFWWKWGKFSGYENLTSTMVSKGIGAVILNTSRETLLAKVQYKQWRAISTCIQHVKGKSWHVASHIFEQQKCIVHSFFYITKFNALPVSYIALSLKRQSSIKWNPTLCDLPYKLAGK